ncbi:MAG: hypothetical protein P0116_10890 [Candidatus Nitrosocosmicus sp.]|nr:hypothetical protein [Candidatus Nitrosocosmicus sp.]
MSLKSSLNDEAFRKFEKLRDNFEWFYSNYDGLRRDYGNQYVAVKDKKAKIDNDCNLEKLIKRLNLSNCDESIAIEYVNN